MDSWRHSFQNQKPWHRILWAAGWTLAGIVFALVGGCFTWGFEAALKQNEYWMVLWALGFAFILSVILTFFVRQKEGFWKDFRDISIDFLQVVTFLYALIEFFQCSVMDNAQSALTIGVIIILSLALALYVSRSYSRDEKGSYRFANKLIMLGTIWFFLSAIYTFGCNREIYFCNNSLSKNFLTWDTGGIIYPLIASFVGIALAFYEKDKELRRQQRRQSMRDRMKRIEKQLQSEHIENWIEGVQELLNEDPKEIPEFLKGDYERAQKRALDNWDTKALSLIDYRLKQEESIDDIFESIQTLLKMEQGEFTLEKEKELKELWKMWEKVVACFQQQEKNQKNFSTPKRNLWKEFIAYLRQQKVSQDRESKARRDESPSGEQDTDAEANTGRNSNEVPDTNSCLETAFVVWDEYDYLARELCVELLIRCEKNSECADKENLLTMLTKNRRRLFRHPRFQNRETFLGIPLDEIKEGLKYDWPLPGKDHPYRDPDSQIQAWLDSWGFTSHPFGPPHAENAGSEFWRFYVPPAEINGLLMPHWKWIRGKRGSGRTALGFHLYRRKRDTGPKTKNFPLFVSVVVPHSSKHEWLGFLLDRVSRTLLGLIKHRPDAFLDLNDSRQRAFARLLLYHLGSCRAVSDSIFSDEAPEEHSVPQKQQRALNVRMREICRQTSPLEMPSYLLLQSMLAVRPADTKETHIILDIQPRLFPSQIHALLVLTTELEKFQVYLKILTLPENEEIWRDKNRVYDLIWDEEKIGEMLSSRGGPRLFDADEEKVIKEFNIYARGLPQRMIKLGNRVLQYAKNGELLSLDDLKKAKEELEANEQQ